MPTRPNILRWNPKTFFFLFALVTAPSYPHDVDLPEWVRVSTACVLDVFAAPGAVEIEVDFRRSDVLTILGSDSWSTKKTPGEITARIKTGLLLDGKTPEGVDYIGASPRYEKWKARWSGSLPGSFDVKVDLFQGLPAQGWCQVFVVPIIGNPPEQSFFFKGDQVFHWPQTLTMPGMTWGRFFRLGYSHILPEGLDHILFVLGLCLAAARFGSLLAQITAFTVAHTITLGLAAKGVITLHSNIVEPLIAASIVLVALENLRKKDPPPWRWMVVFCFGLVHGLGFAGALAETGLPAGAFLSSLFAFNLGVEAGQLTVVGLVLCLLWRFRKKKWYRPRILFPASYLIASVGVFWTLQRVGAVFF